MLIKNTKGTPIPAPTCQNVCDKDRAFSCNINDNGDDCRNTCFISRRNPICGLPNPLGGTSCNDDIDCDAGPCINICGPATTTIPTPTPSPTPTPIVNECFTATYFNISNSQNCSGTPINTIEGICGETCIISEPEDGDFIGSSIMTDCDGLYIIFSGTTCSGEVTPVTIIPFPICFEEYGLKLELCETTDDPTILIITIVSISVVLIITIIVAVFYTKKNNNGDKGYKLQQQH